MGWGVAGVVTLLIGVTPPPALFIYIGSSTTVLDPIVYANCASVHASRVLLLVSIFRSGEKSHNVDFQVVFLVAMYATNIQFSR